MFLQLLMMGGLLYAFYLAAKAFDAPSRNPLVWYSADLALLAKFRDVMSVLCRLRKSILTAMKYDPVKDQNRRCEGPVSLE